MLAIAALTADEAHSIRRCAGTHFVIPQRTARPSSTRTVAGWCRNGKLELGGLALRRVRLADGTVEEERAVARRAERAAVHRTRSCAGRLAMGARAHLSGAFSVLGDARRAFLVLSVATGCPRHTLCMGIRVRAAAALLA